MDIFSSCLAFFWCFNLAFAGVLNRQSPRRNLFTERGCCKRQSHFFYVGQDISGSPVSVDVGICRSHCGGTQRPVAPYGAGFPGFSKHTSMLDFLRTKKLRERPPPELPVTSGLEPSCSAGSSCEPTAVRVERVLLFEGPREVEIIDECHCGAVPTECVRMPALKTFFFETPYETVLDVGKCSSPEVSNGFSCVPTKFEPVLLDSPNSVELVQAVETCELRESCYRTSYIEQYYEVVYGANGIKEERLKEIDVGRCLGGCSSGNRCLLRDSRLKEECLVWAEGSSTSCVPQEYDSHTFRSRNGHIRTVLAIGSCKCQS
ncbi:uncharacterized protein pnhd isoform X1 [Erpetoichthys calabaricus]|uniref:uncharacterized protein pnhd isoform X1 n=1 Tax=Erpetoichthys calabaricus TaxID=27687 RepID=UPI00109EE86B|nr:uncharacterized protein pnhd isoform X1 [Erpetoichthys calabaricus]